MKNERVAVEKPHPRVFFIIHVKRNPIRNMYIALFTLSIFINLVERARGKLMFHYDLNS